MGLLACESHAKVILRSDIAHIGWFPDGLGVRNPTL